MHTNVSTKDMREEGGLEVIKKAIYKLGAKHAEHIAVYGEGNELRLTGAFETASIDQFCYGVANRGASIRIGRDTEAEGKGYFEVSKEKNLWVVLQVQFTDYHWCCLHFYFCFSRTVVLPPMQILMLSLERSWEPSWRMSMFLKLLLWTRMRHKLSNRFVRFDPRSCHAPSYCLSGLFIYLFLRFFERLS